MERFGGLKMWADIQWVILALVLQGLLAICE